jgi:hypothetical protein
MRDHDAAIERDGAVSPLAALGDASVRSRARDRLRVPSPAGRFPQQGSDVGKPVYIVVKAAAEFRDKTTAPNQLWQTDPPT